MRDHLVSRWVQKLFRLVMFVAIIAGLVGANPGSGGEGAAASVGRGELAKVYFHSEPDLNQLAARLDVWEVNRPEGYVLAMVTPAQLSDLQGAGWQVKPVRTPALPAAGPQASGIAGFPCYRTLAEIYARMQELVVQYPALAQVVAIGASWEKVNSDGTGGNDILGLKLTNQAHPGPKPVFFLMAEIHARELTTAETALRFAEYLLGAYGVDPDVTWLLDYYEVQIVPLTNPDGRLRVEADLSSFWRKNTNNTNGCPTPSLNGTDLNRNFSLGWGSGGASTYACDETYMGPSAASEPEVQALQNYLAALFPGGTSPTLAQPALADTSGLLITLHSYSNLVLWPYGTSSQAAPNQAQLQTLGRKLAYFNGYIPEQSYDLYQTSGTTDDWLYGTSGVPAFTFEMGTAFYESCATFESAIWPDNRAALLYAFKSARRPYQNPSGPDITTPSIPSGPIPAGLTVTFTADADATRSSTANGSQPASAIQSARASLDTPSWAAGAITFAVAAADGSFDSSVEGLHGTLDTTSLPAGKHTLFIEAQDSAGDWGPPTAVFLNVSPPFGVSVAPIVSLAKDLAGRRVTFSLTITNQGSLPDSFDLSATNPLSWNLTFPTDSGPLEQGASTTISVTVDIPSGAAPGTISVTQFTAQSKAEPTASQTIAMQTGVLHGYYLPLMMK
jgi:hypothetical protein